MMTIVSELPVLACGHYYVSNANPVGALSLTVFALSSLAVLSICDFSPVKGRLRNGIKLLLPSIFAMFGILFMGFMLQDGPFLMSVVMFNVYCAAVSYDLSRSWDSRLVRMYAILSTMLAIGACISLYCGLSNAGYFIYTSIFVLAELGIHLLVGPIIIVVLCMRYLRKKWAIPKDDLDDEYPDESLEGLLHEE